MSNHLRRSRIGALAALTTGAVADPGERVAVVVCGANVDPATLASA